MKHLLRIQRELKAPKGQYNSFGKYKYRSAEDILEAVKPICHKNDCVLTLSDTLECIGNRYYIKATANLISPDGEVKVNAYAREEETKKGMDGSQITGTASSYARKYALNGLFCIDDTKDADTDDYHNQTHKQKETFKQLENKLTRQEMIDSVVAVCDSKQIKITDICKQVHVKSLEELTDDRLTKALDYVQNL